MDDDALTCPHCGGEAIVIMDNPSSLPWNDGDSEKINCDCCGKELNAVCEVTKVEWKFVDEDWEEINFED